MNQSNGDILHMCKSVIKKIGHNLDSSFLDFSEEEYSEQQVFLFENLLLTQPLFEAKLSLQNRSHFETLSTLITTYFLRKETLWNHSTSNSSSKNNTTLFNKVEYQE